jgi:putative membrane protein
MTGVWLMADMGWDGHMSDWGPGWWILMAFLMIAFWGLLIVGAVWLVRSLGDGGHRAGRSTALDILDRRLAAGEINPEEYRERRATLRDDRPDSSS